MKPPHDPERQRALRRRRKHERQAVIFGTLIAALAVAGVGSAAVYTGTIDSPITRDFTTPTPTATASVSAPPCPSDGTLPVAYADIPLRVLNASSQTGLAQATADQLAERGFVIEHVGNHQGEPVTGTARISFGAAGVDAAYTLAAHVDDPTLVLDTRSVVLVDIALGPEFAGLIDVGLVPLDPEAPLEGVAGCVPLAAAVAQPGPPGLEEEAPGDEDEEVVEG